MNQNFSNTEDGGALSSNGAVHTQTSKASYETPRLTTHGLLRDLTLAPPDCINFPSTAGCEGGGV